MRIDLWKINLAEYFEVDRLIDIVKIYGDDFGGYDCAVLGGQLPTIIVLC